MNDAEGAAAVAVGPGPRWLRLGLAGLAVVYYAALVHRPQDARWIRPAAFFTEATCLFPNANAFAIEYRLEVWACGRQWEALDPRPYFPIQADDKESRFQRLGYFYFNTFTEQTRTAGKALDGYISTHHAAGTDDGVIGPIGGIRVVKVVRPFPAPGEPVERYHFEPLAPVPPAQRRNIYYTPASERKRRCAGS